MVKKRIEQRNTCPEGWLETDIRVPDHLTVRQERCAIRCMGIARAVYNRMVGTHRMARIHGEGRWPGPMRSEKAFNGLKREAEFEMGYATEVSKFVAGGACVPVASPGNVTENSALWIARRKQHHLAANGYTSHEEWLRDCREARSDEFFCCAAAMRRRAVSCAWATVADDGTLTLRLRMPDCLAVRYGKYLTIEGVRFAYGQEQMLAALGSNAKYTRHRRQHGEKAVGETELGQAISYRFERDDKRWRVFAPST